MDLFTYVDKESRDESRDNSALGVLLRRLQLARRQARRHTYRSLAKASGLSPATICRIYNATKPPSWENLERLLQALEVSQVEIDKYWSTLWLNAVDAAAPITVDAADGLISPGREHCPSCGLWIADREAHVQQHEWRMSQDEKLERLEQSLREQRAYIQRLAARSAGGGAHSA